MSRFVCNSQSFKEESKGRSTSDKWVSAIFYGLLRFSAKICSFLRFSAKVCAPKCRDSQEKAKINKNQRNSAKKFETANLVPFVPASLSLLFPLEIHSQLF